MIKEKSKVYNYYKVRFLVDTTLNTKYSIAVRAGQEYQVSLKAIKNAFKTGIIKVAGYDIPLNNVEILKVSKRTQYDITPFDPSTTKGF